MRLHCECVLAGLLFLARRSGPSPERPDCALRGRRPRPSWRRLRRCTHRCSAVRGGQSRLPPHPAFPTPTPLAHPLCIVFPATPSCLCALVCRRPAAGNPHRPLSLLMPDPAPSPYTHTHTHTMRPLNRATPPTHPPLCPAVHVRSVYGDPGNAAQPDPVLDGGRARAAARVVAVGEEGNVADVQETERGSGPAGGGGGGPRHRRRPDLQVRCHRLPGHLGVRYTVFGVGRHGSGVCLGGRSNKAVKHPLGAGWAEGRGRVCPAACARACAREGGCFYLCALHWARVCLWALGRPPPLHTTHTTYTQTHTCTHALPSPHHGSVRAPPPPPPPPPPIPRSGPGPHDPAAKTLEWTRYHGAVTYPALLDFLNVHVPQYTPPYIDSPEALQSLCIQRGGIWYGAGAPRVCAGALCVSRPTCPLAPDRAPALRVGPPVPGCFRWSRRH